MAEKLDMKSMDITQENIAKIRELFPSAVTEVIDGYTKDISGKERPILKLKVDFDVLKQELSDTLIEDKQERYQMTWPDKTKSKLLASSRITSTLRPDKEKSVDFDNTQNLYIEGDNLDVLKLLREAYLGKVKMIYIDPPYNTGSDFIYEDDFAIDSEEYMGNSGQYDEQGNRLVQNKDSNGRFHTDWLNMIYPRLKVAKDLLSDDGVIFISIDDNEQANLKKICDEVFGESNFVAAIKVLSNPRGRQSNLHFANAGEYIFVYAKNKDCLVIYGEPIDETTKSTYNKKDENGLFRDIGLRKRGSDSRREDSPTLYFPIFYNPHNKDISLVCGEGYIEIIPKLEDGSDGRWRWSKAKIKAEKHKLYCREVSRNGKLEYDVFQKDYYDADDTIKQKDFWIEKEINYDRSSEELRELFGCRLFDFAKPIYLIKKIINTTVKKDSIILDFFSGSSSTAHAVMQLNAEDGGNRKFIMVQLPEKCDESSEAYKAGYKTICDIGEERIRRAGQKIIEEKAHLTNAVKSGALQLGMAYAEFTTSSKALKTQEEIKKNLDIGFRVLKLDSSNMQDVYYDPNAVKQSLLDMTVDNIKADRTPLDLLFQVMLDLGKDLSAKIEERQVQGKTIYSVGGNDLVACFDDNITNEVIVEIAKQHPLYAVFKDKSFASDSVAINNEQLFKTYSPSTTIKVI